MLLAERAARLCGFDIDTAKEWWFASRSLAFPSSCARYLFYLDKGQYITIKKIPIAWENTIPGARLDIEDADNQIITKQREDKKCKVPEFVKQVIASAHILSQHVELAKHCLVRDAPPLGLFHSDKNPEQHPV